MIIIKRKIVSIFLIILIFFSNSIYAKYTYTLETNKIQFSRENIPPKYEIYYSEEDWTNDDVEVTLKTNENVETPDGFEVVEEGRVFKRRCTQNEKDIVELKDFSGNITNAEYNVDNIDKIPPQILGVKDGDILNKDVNLQYSDNIGIKEIFVDKYSYLDYRVFDDFYDVEKYLGIDVLDTKATAKILSHPKGTKKYKYYLDGILYGITENVSYTYTGLTPGNTYTVKVEAIDENNNVISFVEKPIETNYFSNMQTEKTDDSYKVIINNINDKIKRYSYVVWSDENKDDSMTEYSGKEILGDRSLSIEFNRLTFKYPNKDYIYRIHIYLYDENNNIISTIPVNVKFGVTVKPQKSIDVYHLEEPGNYQIIVTDFAGNKTEYNITIT